jgi:hypothetical protein
MASSEGVDAPSSGLGGANVEPLNEPAFFHLVDEDESTNPLLQFLRSRIFFEYAFRTA